jgi:hypothetical protein
MKRITRLLGIGALLIVVNLAVGLTPAFAKSVKGTIVSMDGGMLVLRTQDGQEQHFTMGAGVTVPADVQNGSMVELMVGDTSDQATIVSEVRLDAGTMSSSPTPSSASTYNAPSSGTTPEASGTAPESKTETDKPYANTASPIWGFALLGIVAVTGAWGLRRWRESQS